MSGHNGIRPIREADTDEIVGLYARAATLEPGLGPVSRAEWQRFIGLPQNNGCRDFRVAERRGHLIGLAESALKYQRDRKVRYFKLFVDPAARRQGLGSALLLDLLTTEDSSDNLALQTLVSRDWRAGMAFLATLGFAHIESEISMRCSQLAPPTSGTLPAVLIERATGIPRYAADVARIHNAAFASEVAFRFTAEEIARVLGAGELWIASDRGRVLGFCHLQSEEDMVWLESLAVDRKSQARGLGKALAHRALQSNGVCPGHPAGLSVSSKNLAALSLYCRLGFAPRREKCRFSALRSDLVATFERRQA